MRSRRLAPDEGVDVLVAQPFPQYAAEAVAALGAPLAAALRRRAETLPDDRRVRTVLLCGMITERADIDARFPPARPAVDDAWLVAVLARVDVLREAAQRAVATQRPLHEVLAATLPTTDSGNPLALDDAIVGRAPVVSDVEELRSIGQS